ncbi:LL-diaminopimelate aminotransferase [Ammonifex degensii KC4]|uniref:Aminotransferase n=1 Tax=Ammonifex degensii (strain DSM 10501 / KC4) TaxID=429009 RepID=C9R854_AMMDK|nr:LL-diaminopimelate aminotransferase [Ammonifex degensii]ACX52483.1 LL-diaminopimelate aminotransferase [Ammonifex degensii KC4]
MPEVAKRVKNLPPYLFARIEKLIEEKKAAGVDVISLGIGDPDEPTPEHIREEVRKQLEVPENHRYPTSRGLLSFRQAVARYYARRFGVELDPEREVVTLIGSKEGIAHIAWCYLDPGDVALVPDPGYPVYAGGTILAGGEPYYLPLLPENGFLPRLEDVPTEVARRAKILFLNYPNNPTAAVAAPSFFAEVVAFAKEFDLLVCHDAAYVEVAFDGYRPPSFLATPGAKEVGIEFGSLSKPYNMTGWRLGWAAGKEEAVEVLGRLKSNIDSGVFQPIQYAGIKALDGPQECVKEMNALYKVRRDLAVAAFREMGWKIDPPKATFYLWLPVPSGFTSESFAEYLVEEAGVVVTPGTGYGRHGEGFFRVSLTLPTERLQEALVRMKRVLGKVSF